MNLLNEDPNNPLLYLALQKEVSQEWRDQLDQKTENKTDSKIEKEDKDDTDDDLLLASVNEVTFIGKIDGRFDFSGVKG